MNFKEFRSHSEAERWSDSAKIYASSAAQISFLKETSRRLVAIANLESDTIVVDLGCGSSGFVIENILNLQPNVAKIYAVDVCHEMLRELQKRVLSDRLVLLHCPAEQLERHLPEKAHRILVNSAVWLFSFTSAFASIRKSIQDEGLVAFNIAEWHLHLGNGINRVRYELIDETLASYGLPPKRNRGATPKLSMNDVERILFNAGFEIRERQFFTTSMTAEDWKRFYSIPAIIKRSLPELSMEEARIILAESMEKITTSREVDSIQWVEISAAPLKNKYKLSKLDAFSSV